MTESKLWQIAMAWARNLASLRAGSALLSSFGILWLAVQVTHYFFNKSQFAQELQQSWILFFILGIALAAAISYPKLKVSCKLTGRDVIIEIAVGNLFDFPGALIIGSNTTFDTQLSRQLISEKSVQGQFTKKYYGDETQLDAELQSSLTKVPHEDLSGDRIGKNKRYPMGTVVRLNPAQRVAYFVAVAQINQHGAAQGTYEQLKEALANLWVFIGERGTKETLVMPVLGTGFSRLTQPREDVVREIVKSFIAACAEKVFCDKLTIILLPRDIALTQMSLERLGSYIEHICQYTEFSSSSGAKQGTPIE